MRIRRYGLLADRFSKQLLPLAQDLLAAQGHPQLPLPTPAKLRALALPLWRRHASPRALHIRTAIRREGGILMTRCTNSLSACPSHLSAAMCFEAFRCCVAVKTNITLRDEAQNDINCNQSKTLFLG